MMLHTDSEKSVMVLQSQLMKKKGFTLIELVTVIAAVALLVSVILPALNNAKLATKQVICSAQMKQWALATLTYAAENDSEIPPYADTCDWTNSGHALDINTFWYNRLSCYLTEESYGSWGMDHKVRRCPMAKKNWGEKAVWIGVYYGLFASERAPFVFLNEWNGSILKKKSNPVNALSIKSPANYLMMLDTQRDRVFESFQWKWDTDFDGDGLNDSNTGVLSVNLYPFNWALPKIHRGGCNVALFDGHTEWIRYQTFWEIGEDGYPVHPYWWNQNKP